MGREINIHSGSWRTKQGPVAFQSPESIIELNSLPPKEEGMNYCSSVARLRPENDLEKRSQEFCIKYYKELPLSSVQRRLLCKQSATLPLYKLRIFFDKPLCCKLITYSRKTTGSYGKYIVGRLTSTSMSTTIRKVWKRITKELMKKFLEKR